MSETGAPVPAPGMRRFLVLWSRQTLSLFGSFVTQFAINIWLTVGLFPRPSQKPQLALALTVTTLASTAPLILFMPLAGAFADRHDRRGIMLAANGVLFPFAAGLVALTASHALTLWGAALLLAGYSLAGAFHSAAFDSAYGLIVPPGQLGRANGMMQTSFALSQVLSPALAATLVGLPALLRDARATLPHGDGPIDGVPFAFAADAVSFAIAAVGVAWTRFPSPVRAGPRGASVWHDLAEGMAWVVRRPFLWLMSFGALADLTFAPLMVLMPLLVRDRLAADRAAHHVAFPATLALVNACMGAGGVLGGVLMTAWGGLKRRRVLGMAGSIVLLGIGQCVTGLATSIALFSAGLFAAELFVPTLNAHSYLLWQELTPPHLLARALSTRRFIAQISFPIGPAAAGWLATRFEPWAIVTASGALLAAGCLAQIALPAFATLEDRLRACAAADPGG